MQARQLLAAARRRFDDIPVRRRATVRRFHRLYYEHAARTWGDTRWLGVQALKCPLDLWVYQELIAELRPELVVETGTYLGGSALFVASCLELVGSGLLVTIDVQELPGRPTHERIEYVHGSSLDPDVVAHVRSRAEGAAPVLVILDSDHSREQVLAELRAYAPLVTPGSYAIVEDTNVHGHPVFPTAGPGPYEAVEDFLAEGAPFVRDERREKFFLTFNPGGFLQRVDR